MYIFNPGDRVVDQMTWFKSRNCLLWLFGSAGVKFVRLLGIRVLTYEWTLFRSRCKFPEVYYEVYPRKHVSLGWRLLGCGCVFKLGYHWMVNLIIRLYFDWAQVLKQLTSAESATSISGTMFDRTLIEGGRAAAISVVGLELSWSPWFWAEFAIGLRF